MLAMISLPQKKIMTRVRTAVSMQMPTPQKRVRFVTINEIAVSFLFCRVKCCLEGGWLSEELVDVKLERHNIFKMNVLPVRILVLAQEDISRNIADRI